MAKKTEQELLKAEAQTALAAPSPELAGGLTIEGDEQQGPRLSELKLYQGTSTEESLYGRFERGAFIDTLAREKVESPVVAVLAARMAWVRFDEGQNFPVYVHYNKADVPPGDLAPGSGKGDQPAARQQVLAVVIVKGKPWPYLFRFKSTGLAVLNKTIQPLEERRRMTGAIMGVYGLSTRDDKGPGGQAYKRLTATPAGDLPDDMRSLAAKVRAELVKWEAKAKEVASAEAEEPSDHIPV